MVRINLIDFVITRIKYCTEKQAANMSGCRNEEVELVTNIISLKAEFLKQYNDPSISIMKLVEFFCMKVFYLYRSFFYMLLIKK